MLNMYDGPNSNLEILNAIQNSEYEYVEMEQIQCDRNENNHEENKIEKDYEIVVGFLKSLKLLF